MICSRSYFYCLLAALLLAASLSVSAEAPRTQRVLAIGLDGVRPDALAVARTPNLDKLIRRGAYTTNTQILSQRYTKSNTISGPGWSSILTGVWADKHGVHDNKFTGKNYEHFPHFFDRLKSQYPQAQTASFVDWVPIDEHIVSSADMRKRYAPKDGPDYVRTDAEIARDASQHLAKGDPTATFVYLGAIDETGHRHGFHPTVKEYVSAIEVVDGHVGRLMAAIQQRPGRAREDWLILVTTDHGGLGTGHGDGQNVPEIRNVFMIVSGSPARKGPLEGPTSLVDVSYTALVHLGVKIDPAWKLDGQAVGLK